MKKLIDYTKILRSKNAGPLYITFDLIFHSREDMEYVARRLKKEDVAAAYNTDIAQMMVFVNEVYKNGTCPREYAEGFIKMISCVAPHVGEEIWQIMGHDTTIAYESWPTYSEDKCKDSEINIAVQVNGKMRGTVLMEADLENDAVVANVLADEKIAKFLEKQGGSIVKTIVVKNKLVNLIVK